ncbi:hypothetical protein LTR10_009577 [Elasticomyces elasticus]|nr:hypothetical protein LTR10_009577 [Elasticomyces elasticus]KAK4971328.1 hypothetical protein LTR42_007054 [Elasticomyces elasticus]
MSGLQTHLDLEAPVTKQRLAGYRPEQTMPRAAIITILLFVISFIAVAYFTGPKTIRSIRTAIEDTIHRTIDARIANQSGNILVKQAILHSSEDARINVKLYEYHKATHPAKQDMIRKATEDYLTSAFSQFKASLKPQLDTHTHRQIIDSRIAHALETDPAMHGMSITKVGDCDKAQPPRQQSQQEDIIQTHAAQVKDHMRVARQGSGISSVHGPLENSQHDSHNQAVQDNGNNPAQERPSASESSGRGLPQLFKTAPKVTQSELMRQRTPVYLNLVRVLDDLRHRIRYERNKAGGVVDAQRVVDAMDHTVLAVDALQVLTVRARQFRSALQDLAVDVSHREGSIVDEALRNVLSLVNELKKDGLWDVVLGQHVKFE